ncbi:MAG: hypothetical protein O3A53_18400 [Acidobacteria bacterium]|nr:hypothetical protein [Acidobacteriota bacterium]
MKVALLTALLLAPLAALHAATPDLSKVTSRGDLDAVIAATTDAALKQALTENADAIIAAAGQQPHVQAVIATIEKAPGSFTKINTTPEALKKAAGGDIAIFDTLTQVGTNILGGTRKGVRSRFFRDKKRGQVSLFQFLDAQKRGLTPLCFRGITVGTVASGITGRARPLSPNEGETHS